MRLLTLAAIAVAALTLTPGAASAGGLTRCGGGNGRQGGPLVRLFHPFQVHRPAARGCQLATTAFPAAAPVAGVAVPLSPCSGGACPAVRVR